MRQSDGHQQRGTLATAAWFAALGCGLSAGVSAMGCDPSPGPAECHGVCGDGTVCEASKCVVAPEEPEVEPEPEHKGKKKRRRRGKKHAAAEPGTDAAFVPVNDSHIPKYRANADKTLDLDVGTERLSDRVVIQHLGRLESQFNRCIATSAAAFDDNLAGELDFVIGIKGSGKVAGVTVKSSKSLRDAGVVPCVRKVVYGHRFPEFDGQTMGVDYSFKVD